MVERGHLRTEQRNPRSRELDALSVDDAFALMNDEHAPITGAISAAKTEIVAAIEMIVGAMRRGGRVRCVGSGTRGRLRVAGAAGCPPAVLRDPCLLASSPAPASRADTGTGH